MANICLFPGTFDPITNGHVDIINRSIYLFDKIIIGIGINTNKQPMFTIEQRIAYIQEIFKDEEKIEVVAYEGLTINFAKSIQATSILRGIRTIADFEYEKAISDMNRVLEPSIETIFLACAAVHASTSSTLVRDLIKYNQSVDQFVPQAISNALLKK